LRGDKGEKIFEYEKRRKKYFILDFLKKNGGVNFYSFTTKKIRGMKTNFEIRNGIAHSTTIV
jgi:cytoplasmic iron level regulating protein YaaA (DUF328/UPF0246 family)